MSLKRKSAIVALVLVPPAVALMAATAIGWLRFDWSWGGVVLALGVYAAWIAVLGGLAEYFGFFREKIPRTVLTVAETAMPPTAPCQAPRPRGDFVGRESAIEKLVEALKPGGKAAITGVVGMGGIGKTELAKVVAHEVADRFGDGVLWADCGQLEPVAIADLWAAAYDRQLPGDDLPAKAAAWLGLVGGKEALLVFDNVQPGQKVEPLFPSRGGSAVLVTTRHAGHPGLREAEPLRLDQFSHEEAMDLAERVLGREAARRQAGEAARLFELAGYLPLAVSIALYLAKECDWALGYLNGRLEERGAIKTLDSAEGLRKSLQATFETAWENLSAELQLTFRALAVFNQGPSFGTLALAETMNVEEPEAKARLRRLAGRSLLVRVGEERWSLHSLLRQFAAGRGPVSDALWVRMARHYEQAARAASELYKQGHENVFRGLELFDLEWPHIEAGRAWAAARVGRGEAAAQLCSDYADAAIHCLSLRLPPGERALWLEAAVRAARWLEDEKAEGVHLGNLGSVYRRMGEWERAIETYERSLEIKERVGDVHGMATTWTNLGLAYLQTDRSEEARPLFARAYLTLSRMGSPDAGTALRGLSRACGSDEAAEAYLAGLTTEQS